ncbi:MAG: type II toxin-antitoxin system RelE family toxin [Thermoplasmata archaeon]
MKAALRYVHSAARELAELDQRIRLVIVRDLRAIVRDPRRAPRELDVRRLDGYPGYWRLSAKKHRLIYHFDGTTVEVWFIELRTSDTYDRLRELPNPHIPGT